MTEEDAIRARLDALESLMDEREERNKERYAALEKTIMAALSAADKALNKAETAIEKRFDSVNEFRKTLADQSATLLSRAEYHAQHSALIDKIETVEKVISTINLALSSLQNRATGKSEGLSIAGQIVLGMIAAVASGAAVATALHFGR